MLLLMETSVIRSGALSGVLCLIWVICSLRFTVRTKSLCRPSVCFSNHLEHKHKHLYQPSFLFFLDFVLILALLQYTKDLPLVTLFPSPNLTSNFDKLLVSSADIL